MKTMKNMKTMMMMMRMVVVCGGERLKRTGNCIYEYRENDHEYDHEDHDGYEDHDDDGCLWRGTIEADGQLQQRGKV